MSEARITDEELDFGLAARAYQIEPPRPVGILSGLAAMMATGVDAERFADYWEQVQSDLENGGEV